MLNETSEKEISLSFSRKVESSDTVRGYVMKYSDVPLNDTVKTWNTKILQVCVCLNIDKPYPETQGHPYKERILGRYGKVLEYS
jgi:hypothetical protein